MQTYWLWAAAKVGNEPSVRESMAAIYRPAALFLTNNVNFVADNGDFSGIVINSSNKLWSLSGNLSIIHKVIFGIRFMEYGLAFSPFVPTALAGNRSLTNFNYRDAVLEIVIEGYGNDIQSFFLDGKRVPNTMLPTGIKGKHHVKIILYNSHLPNSKINQLANQTFLATPLVGYEPGVLSWLPVEGAKSYKVLRNEIVVKATISPNYEVNGVEGYAVYQLIALDKNGMESFASEPLEVMPKTMVPFYVAEQPGDKQDIPIKVMQVKGLLN